MAETYKKLDQEEIPAAQTQLYEVPASTQAIVKHIRIVSTSASDRWAKLWHTDGAAPVDQNLIFPAMTITAGGMAEFEGTILMEAGDKLYGESEAASELTITVYGLEIS